MAIIKQYHPQNDTTYVYESYSYWVPELKQSRSVRRCIGKIDPETGEIVPTGKRGRKPKAKKEDSGSESSSGDAYEKLQDMTARYEHAAAELTELRVQMAQIKSEAAELRKQNNKLRQALEEAAKICRDVL